MIDREEIRAKAEAIYRGVAGSVPFESELAFIESALIETWNEAIDECIADLYSGEEPTLKALKIEAAKQGAAK